MLKRIIYITFIILLTSALAYFYVQINRHSEVKTTYDIIEVIPNNAGIIIEIPNFKSFTHNENWHSELWAAIEQVGPLKDYGITQHKWENYSKTSSELINFGDQPALISYHLIGQKIATFFAIKFTNKASEKAWELQLEANQQGLEKKYNGVSIYKFGKTLDKYAYQYHSYFAVSDDPILLEQSIRHLQTPHETAPDFNALRKTKGSECDANILINYDRLQMITSALTHSGSNICKHLSEIGEWGELDFSINENQIVLNGFSSFDSNDYWQIFSKQENTKLTIQEAIPSYSKGFIILSPSNIPQFRKDYESYLHNTDRLTDYQDYWKSLIKRGVSQFPETVDQIMDNEIAYCYDNKLTNSNNEATLIIKTHSASLSKEQLTALLSEYAKNKNHKLSDYTSTITIDNETDFKCYTFPFEDSFSFLYGNIFKGFKAKYLCFYDNYLILTSEKDALKKALTANILKQTYANDTEFINLFGSFSSKSSLFYFEKTSNILPKICANTSEEFCAKNHLTDENFHNLYALVYQMVSSNKYMYNSILLNYNPELKDKPTTVWTSHLDGAPVGKPTFVKNHYTNENEICIQDDLNILYLISHSGRIIWQKPIGEPIMSEITQIDYFNNGKLQLLFNTKNKLWLLDRDGNYVERYPILLPSPATTALSLFDYDNNKDYRIFIPTEDKHIYLFNINGNLNKGFEFGTTEELLSTPVQHFRIGGKDYLVAADKNRIYILNRKGQERVKLQKPFSASVNNSFFSGKDDKYFLATTDKNGTIVKIYMDGTIKQLDTNQFSDKHYFAMEKLDHSGEENFIIVDKGLVNVYNFRGRILYSKRYENAILSRPYFYTFASNDVKIGITDILNNNIYLLNGDDGNNYNGFPLIGTGPFSIGFLSSSSWRFNLIVGGENSTLYNYKVK